MASNFNSFAPYNASQSRFSETIYISAEDRLEEIIVNLKAISCSSVNDINSPWDWPSLTLEGYKAVTMFIKEYQSDDLHTKVVGVPMAPLSDGNVLFRMPGSAFGGASGRYVGLIEVEYNGSDTSGNKVITARNYIPFEVREEFYCDPFDPDFGDCSRSN